MAITKRLKSEIIFNRDKYLSPSYKTVEAFQKPIILERGKMQYVWDIHNNKYIDMTSQNIVISVGHSHPKVLKKINKQLETMPHCSSMYIHKAPGLLAKKLVEKMPDHSSGEDWVVHFVNDGSEAVDLSIQMAREYTGNTNIFGLYKGYHGLQGYAAGLTAIGKASQNCYNSMFTGITHVELNKIEQLDNHLKYGTSGNVAGIIIEPLQGYGGINPLDYGYMKDAFELIRENNGVAISDEVQTGFGRCGESFWGFQMKNNDAIPDIVTIAKGMGNGMGIIGAVICRKSIADAFSKKMFFNTYGGNPISTTASLAVLDIIDNEDMISNCNKMGDLLTMELSNLCDKYPSVYSEIRGKGLFQALEIYGTTPEKSIYNSIKLHNKTLNYGVLMGRGSAAGNVFRIQPPMCINRKDVMTVVEMLEDMAIGELKN